MFFTKCLLLCVVGVAFANALPGGIGAPKGAPKTLSGSELKASEDTLRHSLTTLAAGEGPNYRLSKILSASTQVVSGSLDKYRAELIDSNGATKTCDIAIWSQRWLPNGIEVTFECDGEPKLVRKHNA